MELQDALSQIAEIRARMAQDVYRGFRSVTVAFSGVSAIAGAVVQGVAVPDPMRQLGAYLALWLTLAAACLVVTALEMGVRCRMTRSPAARRDTRLVVEQFVLCVAAGGLVTAVLARCAPAACWLLPGLWAILFGLGIFSIGRLLPRATRWVGLFYLTAGVFVLIASCDAASFGGGLSPWFMGGVFGPGQLAAAGILYATLERVGSTGGGNQEGRRDDIA